LGGPTATSVTEELATLNLFSRSALKGIIHPKTMFGRKTRSFYIAVGGETPLGLTGSI